MTPSIFDFHLMGLVVDEENICNNSLQVGTNDRLEYNQAIVWYMILLKTFLKYNELPVYTEIQHHEKTDLDVFIIQYRSMVLQLRVDMRSQKTSNIWSHTML